MSETKGTTVRLRPEEKAMLAELQKKMNLKQSALVSHAIKRLYDDEIGPNKSPEKP